MKKILQYSILLFVSFFLVGCSQNNLDRQNSDLQQLSAENAKREYVLKRKEFCLEVYKTESDKKDNVQGWRYFEANNECFIIYKSAIPQTSKGCDSQYPPTYNPGETYSGRTYAEWNDLCKDGIYEKSF